MGVLASHPLSAYQAQLIPDLDPTTYFTQGFFEPDAERTARLTARGVGIERAPFVELLGCTFDEGSLGPFIRVDDWKQTTIPGVYAEGDAASWMHNATVAAASGVTAGIGAHQSLAGSTGKLAAVDARRS